MLTSKKKRLNDTKQINKSPNLALCIQRVCLPCTKPGSRWIAHFNQSLQQKKEQIKSKWISDYWRQLDKLIRKMFIKAIHQVRSRDIFKWSRPLLAISTLMFAPRSDALQHRPSQMSCYLVLFDVISCYLTVKWVMKWYASIPFKWIIHETCTARSQVLL